MQDANHSIDKGQEAPVSCALCGRAFATLAARSGHMPTHRGGKKGELRPEDRCPGSGTTMVSRTYTVRKIEPEDRTKYARFAHNARDVRRGRGLRKGCCRLGRGTRRSANASRVPFAGIRF